MKKKVENKITYTKPLVLANAKENSTFSAGCGAKDGMHGLACKLVK